MCPAAFEFSDVAAADHAHITNYGVICCIAAARDRFTAALKAAMKDCKSDRFTWRNTVDGEISALSVSFFCLADLLSGLWSCITASDTPRCTNNISSAVKKTEDTEARNLRDTKAF